MNYYAFLTKYYDNSITHLVNLKCSSLKQALINLKTIIKENYTNENKLESILLIEGNSINIDSNSIYNEINLENQIDQDTKDKLEFERLKKKFNQ